MLTEKFKYVLLGAGAALVVGGLTANQLVLIKEVNSLKAEKSSVVVKVLPSAMPSASPSASATPTKYLQRAILSPAATGPVE